MKDHNGRDKSSHLVKHTIEPGHDPVCHGNFRILDKGHNNTFKRKVVEALLIKRAGTHRTPKMKRIAKTVNGLSHRLFLLGAPS